MRYGGKSQKHTHTHTKKDENGKPQKAFAGGTERPTAPMPQAAAANTLPGT